MRPLISLQLYTLRDLTKTDILGTLEAVSQLGYQGVEVAGCGNSEYQTIGAKASNLGLKVTGNHVGLGTLENDQSFEEATAATLALGTSYLITSGSEAASLGPVETWRDIAALLDSRGRQLKQKGITLCYHNHAFEFEAQYNGEYALDILFSSVDAEFLQTEIDCYWVQKGGISPSEYLRKYKERIPMVHIKDMDANGNFAEVGNGLLDWPAIFRATEEGGTHTLVVEQDICAGPPLESVALSLENLRKMELIATI
jgi:sugar phosphate isomerase/epimerase